MENEVKNVIKCSLVATLVKCKCCGKWINEKDVIGVEQFCEGCWTSKQEKIGTSDEW
jgi:hypothetical protein